MNTTRSLLDLGNARQRAFIDQFADYLDSMDKAFHIQSKIGLERAPLGRLPESSQKLFKTYLFFVESANTTCAGALHLFSIGLYADCYSLLRMLYEVACLMHFGNVDAVHAQELYSTFFNSGLDDSEHKKGEWRLTQKATREWESSKPDLVPVRQQLNNFGSHISRAKIVLGNVAPLGDQTSSTLFHDCFGRKEFLAGLDMLYALMMMTIEEYNSQAIIHPGAEQCVKSDIQKHNIFFANHIRPDLISRIKD